MMPFPIRAALSAVLALASVPAFAQNDRASAAVQRDYDAFIVTFRAALKANDAAKVTELTQFPFYAGEMRDAGYFRTSLYAKIFTPRIRTCLARAKAVYARAPDGSETFTAFCGEDLFLFTRTKEGFRFTETGVND